MEKISKRVSEYLSTNPCILQAVQLGVVNTSSLARYIMKEIGTQKYNAVVAALKRYPQHNPSLESEYRKILRQSRIEAYFSISNITVKNTPEVFDKLSNLYKSIVELGGKFRAIQGVQGTVIVVDSGNMNRVMDVFGQNVLSVKGDLGELVIISPEVIQDIRGYVAYISSILASNGINIYQIASFYTDLTFIMEEKFMNLGLSILSRLSQSTQVANNGSENHQQ